MSRHISAQPATSEDQPTAADVLESQAKELDFLLSELIKTYEKEIAFFGNLESRDSTIEAQKRKIAAQARQISDMKRQLTMANINLDNLQSDYKRINRLLKNLQKSPLGRLQRKYWAIRKGGRS